MSTPTLHERRDALEQEIARIQEKNKGRRPPAANRTSPDFLEKYTGMFADDPMFDAVMRDIEERREREEANRAADEAEAAE
jgi:hypothetical protein